MIIKLKKIIWNSFQKLFEGLWIWCKVTVLKHTTLAKIHNSPHNFWNKLQTFSFNIVFMMMIIHTYIQKYIQKYIYPPIHAYMHAYIYTYIYYISGIMKTRFLEVFTIGLMEIKKTATYNIPSSYKVHLFQL